MAKYHNLLMIVLLVAVGAVGSLQGAHVTHLRDSEKFYRWIMAKAVDERTRGASEQAESEEYSDHQLYQVVQEKAAPNLPEGLTAVIGDRANDKAVWKLASGKVLAEPRSEFRDLGRAGKLQFAQDITYAQAGASNVHVFNLFFGFKKIAASFLWIQVDRYWHSGSLHRMIPMMNTVVMLDPNFVDAYLIGAWHLAYNATATMEDTAPHDRVWHPGFKRCLGKKETYYYLGVKFLKDGIRKNPRDYKLYFDLGFAVYKNKLKDYASAVRYLSEAVRQRHERWVPRQLYICYELNGQYDEAIAGWKQYQDRFAGTTGADDTAPRFIKRNRGLIHERDAKEARTQAAEASNPDEAKQKLRLADESEQKAKEVWESMDDPFADARLLRMEAVKLASEARYLEAIAVLDKARWESSQFFEEASGMIIEYKQLAGIPLSVSEMKAVLRKEGGERCQGMPEEATAAS